METILTETLRFGSALLVLGVFVWTAWVIHRHYRTRSYPIRLTRMMSRLGIATRNAEILQYETHLPTAARLCHSCTNKGWCDAWIDELGITDPPEFCPNAQFFRLIAEQSKHAA
jgi:hypothetical protein